MPERRRIFKESSVIENLRIGGIIAKKTEAKKDSRLCLYAISRSGQAPQERSGVPQRWRTADVGYRPCINGATEILVTRRTPARLSPGMEEILVEAIKDINREMGLSIMIAEQYARPIFPIITYGYVLENGGVVVEGTAEELMANEDVKSAYFGMADE